MKFSPLRDTPENFWQTLTGAALVQGDMPADPQKDHGDTGSPWFVKAMLGVTAWLSSLFFLIAVTMFRETWFNDAGTRAILGIIACLLATVYFRKRASSVFLDQIFFVLALLGQMLIVSAIPDRFLDTTSSSWLLAAAVETLVLIVIPYRPNRFLSALAALIFLHHAMFFWSLSGLFVPACLAALAVVLHYQWKTPQLWPAVVVTLSLAPFFATGIERLRLIESIMGWNRYFTIPVWLWQTSLIAVWLGVVYALLQRVTAKPFSPENTGIWLLACLLAAGTWPVPLALFALAVLCLGFSQRDKLLEGIGVIQLLWAVGYYYYALETTLLLKSLTLSALGAVLLLLYAASRHLLPATARGEKA
jgi:hypothetical protein